MEVGPPRLIFPRPNKKPISNQLSGLYIYRNRGVRVHSPPSLSSRAPHPLSHALPPSPHPTVPCLLSGPSSLLSPTLPCLPLNLPLPHQQPIWRSSRAWRPVGPAAWPRGRSDLAAGGACEASAAEAEALSQESSCNRFQFSLTLPAQPAASRLSRPSSKHQSDRAALRPCWSPRLDYTSSL